VIHRAQITAKDRETQQEWNLAQGSEILPAQAALILDDLTTIVVRACAEIAAVSPSTIVKRAKADQSPVTSADEASEEVILKGLAQILPAIPVIAEESAGSNQGKLDRSFLIVDPLDGTREFLAGRDEYTVNLAIVTRGVPIAGIIAAPKRGQVWRGIGGLKAERLRLLKRGTDRPQAIRTRRWPGAEAVAVTSRSHFDADTDQFLVSLGSPARHPSGSAIKFCQVAEGNADVYARLSPTCEWDVAAGHALIVAAGGVMTNGKGSALAYGRADDNFRVPAFIAWGDPDKAAAARV
jgi:3'(2'), 5'-bisphosphate nucleotidase